MGWQRRLLLLNRSRVLCNNYTRGKNNDFEVFSESFSHNISPRISLRIGLPTVCDLKSMLTCAFLEQLTIPEAAL